MDLEDQFDVVIIGTGLAESILSAACSRIGKTVLHLDNNSFYGEGWSSFNFEQLVEWLKYGKVNDALYFHSADRQEQLRQQQEQQQNENAEPAASTSTDNRTINWSDFYKTITNVEIISYLINEERKAEEAQTSEATNDKWWTNEEFKKLSRKFNIDLCPKLLFSAGSMVNLLVTSNISRYMSFKNVTRLLCNKDNGNLDLIQVPYSRQTTFTSKDISLIEKRLLMKFIQFCLEDVLKDQTLIEPYNDRPFVDLMNDKNLTPFLQKVILKCVLFTSDSQILTNDAMSLIKKFVDSSGRYGTTPFLSPLYGSGEIPQSFCRLSAVFAGTFLLNNTIEKVLINRSDEEIKPLELIYRGKTIKTDQLITSVDSTPKTLINTTDKSLISRGIFITDKSLKRIDDEAVINRESTLICLDFGDNYHNVYILELSSSLCVCPDNLYLVYIWVDSVQSTAKQDLLPIVKKLFNFKSKTEECESKPNIVWSCYFNSEYVNGLRNENLAKNHHILSTSFNELDYDKTIDEAKQVFTSIFPDCEFLPRAPEPDEIVMEVPKIDEQENGVKEEDEMDLN